MNPHLALMLARPISEESGPGIFLRTVVVATVVGICLFVWVLARAHRDND